MLTDLVKHFKHVAVVNQTLTSTATFGQLVVYEHGLQFKHGGSFSALVNNYHPLILAAGTKEFFIPKTNIKDITLEKPFGALNVIVKVIYINEEGKPKFKTFTNIESAFVNIKNTTEIYETLRRVLLN